MPVTYKPTNVVNSPFIRYSGTSANTSPNLLSVILTFVSQEEAKGSINLDALLDTGCLAGDFAARRVEDK